MATSDITHLDAKSRDGLGKKAVKSIRKEGVTPGIIYGLDKDPQPVAIDSVVLGKLIHVAAGKSLIEVSVDGGDAEAVTILEIQRDVLSRQITHIDFKRIDLTQTSVFTIRIALIGDSVGVRGGGVLNLIEDSAEVECLPTDLPDKIEIDISELDIGDAIYARDIKLPDGVELKIEANNMLVNIGAPIAEEVEAAPVLTEAQAAAAAAAEEDEAHGEEGAEKKPERDAGAKETKDRK
jgi:large subunit ribosomal protein L25